MELRTFGDVRRGLRDEGWCKQRQKGSHEQWYHPDGRGPVTVAGKDSHTVPPGTWNSIKKQMGASPSRKELDILSLVMLPVTSGGTPFVKKVVVVVEPAVQDGTVLNYCSYAPDWPGCVSAGDTPMEALALIKEALSWHIGALTGEELSADQIDLIVNEAQRGI